ncbi:MULTISPECIES: hypothetical protein [Halomonadaceae]|uniref:hypothetical protein n=1 Tax=Halomonadaceae TaxID=28256 RepID=UPI003FD88FFC
MSGFSKEYLAQVEIGMKLEAATSDRLFATEELLRHKPTSAAVRHMVKHLGLCAASVRECENFDAIMPHDCDDLRNHFMMLVQQAGEWIDSSF